MADLKRAGATLARELGLPNEPTIRVGYVPWKGPDTSEIELMGAPHGFFTVARWAVRGKYRRSWNTLEYRLVCGIGFWLESHRRRMLPKGERPGLFDESGTNDTLRLWYGAEMGDSLVARRERAGRQSKWVLLVVGATFLLVWLYTALR